jgi:SAM-dependent methyltransferase
MHCRHCATALDLQFVDLNSAPPSNSYLTKEMLSKPETWYPLRVMVCRACWLVQTEDFAKRDEFFSEDYAYFSSFSNSWLQHAEAYVSQMVPRFGLTTASHVVEVASNDGYLLQYFKKLGIPCLGIEPTASTAEAARAKGIQVLQDFFGVKLARKMVAEGLSADLIIANNVLAHVPDINDFTAGFATLLKPDGVATFEFPHIMSLVADSQFDTIYHEHFSYLSLTAVNTIFLVNGLTIIDVEKLPTHGGSLRVYSKRSDSKANLVTDGVTDMLEIERQSGVSTDYYYQGLQSSAEKISTDLVYFLIEAQKKGKRVAGYGGAAKGNTLLNFAGVHSHLLSWVVDRNPAKQGKYLPGSRIPIVAEECIRKEKPDYILILPWNLQSEVMTQLSYIREWGGQFVCAVPSLKLQ